MTDKNIGIFIKNEKKGSERTVGKKLFMMGLSLLLVGALWMTQGTNSGVFANEMEGNSNRGGNMEILNDIQILSYDKEQDYMAKMYQACLDGSHFALEAGAIYEAQRNLKIETENLDLEYTNFFDSGETAETIQYEIEIHLGIIQEPEEALLEMSVPAGINTSFKAYMDYRTITSRGSTQYKMQQQAYTENGFRKLDGRYMVAMGSYYGYCGDKFNITFDTGTTIPVIIGDSKADRHTDSLHMYKPMKHGYGNVVEFIIDSRTIDPIAKKMGDVSHVSAELQGNVVKIEKLI